MATPTSYRTAQRPAETRDQRGTGQAEGAGTKGWRGYLKALGPGLVTGASDDDPSGIASYAQAGAQFRYGMLWSALITFPLMSAVLEICDRTALATGHSLGRLCRQHFARRGRIVVTVLLLALLVANTANITADLLAIGAGANLLGAGPTWVWALLAGIGISVLLGVGSFNVIARIFKYLCLTLLTYVAVLVVAHVNWTQVAERTFIPHVQINGTYAGLLVAVLGTTVSPYLFFWQTAHRIEDLESDPEGGDAAAPLNARPPHDAERKRQRSRFDVFTGVALNNVVMFAIIVATASTLGSHGTTNIGSAAAAAKALQPIAGNLSSVLFAVGFIGAGFLAVPVLAASASIGIAALYDKDWGFSRRLRQAPLFYGLVALGTIGGTALSLVGLNPIRLLVIVGIINGVAAAPFLAAVMLIARDPALMGKRRNGRLATTLGWGTVALMGLAAVVMFATGGA
jgi:NRAMP (natural resistance-associated macrophage protein)-like metal ion transporter